MQLIAEYSRLLRGSSSDKSWNAGIYCGSAYALVVILVGYMQFFSDSLGLVDGYFVSDSVSYLYAMHRGTAETGDVGWGIYFLYYLPLQISSILILFVNLAFILWSCFVVSRLIDDPKYKWMFQAVILFNPYLLLCVWVPNKEIPLTALSLYAFYVVHSRGIANVWWIMSVIMAGVIRFEYGLILFASLLAARFLWNAKIAAAVLVLPCLLLVYCWENETYFGIEPLENYFKFRDSISASVATDSDAGIKEMLFRSSSPVIQVWQYFARVFINGFSLLTRSPFTTDSGSLSVLGVSYFVYGSILSATVIICFLSIVIRRKGVELEVSDHSMLCNRARVVFIFVLFSTSINHFIQPRYLMPAVPIGVLCLWGGRASKLIWCCALIVLAYLMLYQFAAFLLSIAPPPPTRSDILNSDTMSARSVWFYHL